MPKTLLVIDDDQRIQDLLGKYFEKNGFETCSALTGTAGLRILEGADARVDLIILDIMLPEMDGFETLRRIRMTSNIPVIMLTAKEDETDRIVGLEMGADDYLSKPFNPRELLARVKAVLRRTTPGTAVARDPSAREDAPVQVRSMGLVMNPATRQAALDGQTVHLSTVEFDILYALVCAKGRVVSRDELMTLARGMNFEAFDRSIDVHVSRIRKKIEPEPARPVMLRTIWGKGYLWSDDQDGR